MWGGVDISKGVGNGASSASSVKMLLVGVKRREGVLGRDDVTDIGLTAGVAGREDGIPLVRFCTS